MLFNVNTAEDEESPVCIFILFANKSNEVDFIKFCRHRNFSIQRKQFTTQFNKWFWHWYVPCLLCAILQSL